MNQDPNSQDEFNRQTQASFMPPNDQPAGAGGQHPPKTRAHKLKKIILIVLAIIGALTIVFWIFITLISVSSYQDVQSQARDAERTNEINAIADRLEVYNNDNGTYPSVEQMENPSWRENNLSLLSAQEFIAPNGKAINNGGYTYAASPAGCQGTLAEPCTAYKLSVDLENGELYSRSKIN